MIKLLIFCALIGNALSGLKCMHDGKEYEKGETWVSKNNFKMRCDISEDVEKGLWVVSPIACVTKKGQEVEPGSQAEEDGMLYKCSKRGDSELEFQFHSL